MEIRELITHSNHIENVWEEVEVERSLDVWHYLSVHSRIDDLTIQQVHHGIMTKLYPAIAGKYRIWDVQVGMYMCPPWQRVPMLMRIWLAEFAHQTPQQAHINFEKIHPFADGNGRVGRMLMWWQELRLGVPFTEITYDKRFQYYDWFA